MRALEVLVIGIMTRKDFEPNLIRLPLDYEGKPELAEIRLVLPSHISLEPGGGRFEMGVQLLDRWGFHIPKQRASLHLEIEGGPGELPETLKVLPEHDSHLRVPGVFMEGDRVYRVRARDLATGVEALSNPAWCARALYGADFKLFWGDIHAHRIEVPQSKTADPLLWSYGPATVHEFYQYARDVVHLDFAALTDHDYALTVDEWRQIQEGAVYYNQPERFVTFPGYEWAWNDGPSADHGHRNVLFLHDDMPLISGSWRGSDTPQDLYRTLQKISRTGADFLVIPHHTARLPNRIWHDWESTDPEVERLFEMYSLWGSGEKEGPPFEIRGREEGMQTRACEAVGHFLQDGLRRGLRFGFTGGSETHDGRASNPVMHGSRRFKEVPFAHRPGLVGVWARRKTRGGLWSSLWGRRTVATTGVRVILDVDLDNQPMGELIHVTRAPERLRVRVHGTGPLSSVVVVRNNLDWHTLEDPGRDCTFALEDLPLPEGTDWYYVRATQQDGNMAWSSPIWVHSAISL